MKKLLDLRRPPTALRVLDTLLWLALPLVAAMTVVVLVFGVVLPVFGDNPYYVQGRTGEVVIEHTTPSGITVVQDLSDQSPFVAPEDSAEPYVRFLSASVQAQVSGFGPRLVLIIASLADIAFAWIAVLTLKGITRSSLKGEIFTTANSQRLARLGKVAIAYPLVAWWVGRSLFNSVATDEDLGVSGFWSHDGVGNSLAWVGCALLLFILAKAFTWGVELQELESATI